MLALDAYPYQINAEYFDYTFESKGPKGSIKKIARFTSIGNDTYNLAFGDLDESSGEILDMTRSSNKDVEKILATLANIFLEFTTVYPWNIILIRGSSMSRTRLYQININKFWDEISNFLLVWGYRNNEWESFVPGQNYEAFLGKRK